MDSIVVVQSQQSSHRLEVKRSTSFPDREPEPYLFLKPKVVALALQPSRQVHCALQGHLVDVHSQGALVHEPVRKDGFPALVEGQEGLICERVSFGHP